MAGKDVSFKVSAKDEATGTLNKVAGSVNSFSKETKEALKPLDNLNKSFSSITKAFTPLTVGITAAVAGLKKLSDAVKVCTDEWAKDELAMKRIDFAGTINKHLAGTTKELKDLANSIEEMTHGWVGAGDVMDSMSSMLYDKTTPQIKEIILAATDLSAAMGTDLNSAVTQLNNLLAGTTGTLGKMFPELKNFSKEQHEAGDSVAYVAEKVKGAATAFSNTTEGIKREAEESKNALKSAFGDFFTELTVPMTTFFTNLRQKITGIINNINDTRRAIKQLESDDLRVQLEGAQTLWDKAVAERDAARTLVENYAAANRSSIQATASANGMTENQVIKNLIETNAAWKKANEDVIKYSAQTVELQKQLRDYLATTGAISVDISNPEDISTDIAASISDGVSDAVTSGITFALGGLAKTFGVYDLNFGSTINLAPAGASNASVASGDDRRTNASRYGTGETWDSALFKELLPVLSAIGAQFQSISALMDPITTVLSVAITVLQPVIDSVLTPLVGVFAVLGQTIGQMLVPVVQILTPVISLVCDAFVWLYNKVLRPIGNAFITLFNMVYDAVAAVANGFISIYNVLVPKSKEKSLFKYKALDENHIDEITTGSLTSAGAAYMGGGTSGASYTAARDITVNLTYSHSFVNGDAQEIAIQIKKELEAVTALGY